MRKLFRSELEVRLIKLLLEVKFWCEDFKSNSQDLVSRNNIWIEYKRCQTKCLVVYEGKVKTWEISKEGIKLWWYTNKEVNEESVSLIFE